MDLVKKAPHSRRDLCARLSLGDPLLDGQGDALRHVSATPASISELIAFCTSALAVSRLRRIPRSAPAPSRRGSHPSAISRR